MELLQPATFTFWQADNYQLNHNVGHREFDGILARPPLDKPKLSLRAGYITFTLPRAIYADFQRNKWAKVGVVTDNDKAWWHVQTIRHIYRQDVRHLRRLDNHDDWLFWGEHWLVACEIVINSIVPMVAR